MFICSYFNYQFLCWIFHLYFDFHKYFWFFYILWWLLFPPHIDCSLSSPGPGLKSFVSSYPLWNHFISELLKSLADILYISMSLRISEEVSSFEIVKLSSFFYNSCSFMIQFLYLLLWISLLVWFGDLVREQLLLESSIPNATQCGENTLITAIRPNHTRHTNKLKINYIITNYDKPENGRTM